MMQQMRVYAKSWIAYLFVIPLALSFAVWGIGDMIRNQSADTSVATIGDVKITPERFQREYRTMQRQMTIRLKHQVTPEEARAQGLDRQLLKEDIANVALDQAVTHYGFQVSDAEVSNIIQAQNAFRSPLGMFDRQLFGQWLLQEGMTEDQFADLVRSDLTRNQLVSAVSDTPAPEGYAKLFFSYVNEHRAADYIQVSAKDLPPTRAPSDSELTAYLKAHASEFSTPEYRDIVYLSVGPDDVAKQLKVADADLKQRYDAAKDLYHIPEKRDVQQIIFPDEASAKAARAKIDAGAKFEDVAKAAGKSQSDISLGTLVQADLGADRGPATFGLPKDGVTQPVKDTFGWVLLHVTAITPAVNTPFESVKETLRNDEIRQLAGAKITEISNAFDDARAGGASFTDAGAKVGMHVTHIPQVDKDGLGPDGKKVDLPTEPEFLARLAKADVGEEGDPFDTSDAHSFVIKVIGETPTKLKSLDSVRAQITAAWMADQRAQALAKFAASLAAKATADKDLKPVAAQLHTNVQTSGALTRETESATLSPAAISHIFAAPPGSAVSAPGANGTYIIARVTGVAHPVLPPGAPMYARFQKDIGNDAGTDMAELLGNAWRDKLGVTVNQAQVDHLAGGL
jgi:peptidyl-prolyl cis-trans isomerase D